jgi:spermidine synthase
MSESLVRRTILEFTVFNCGALVMAYEIIGSRILAPFIGTSTYVWTSLIGVILASLSLGYWLGGRMADRRPDIKLLASIIFFAGGLISVTVLVKEIVLSSVASAPVGVELRSLIASIVLFGPASICLGFVTPYAVKLRMSSLADAGKTVGRLYAMSTVGSIAGTFAAGFFLIPFVGSTRTLYLIAAALIVNSVLLAPFALRRTTVGVIVVFLLSIVSNEANTYLLREVNGLYDIDTEYSRIQVFRTIEPHSGKAIQAMATDPYFIQSAMLLDSDEPAFEYSRYYHLARHFKSGFRDALVIGGAGYSVPKDFLRRYPDVKIDVVEIDPQMTAIARRFFRLTDNSRLSIVHDDGRTFLGRSAAGKYDVIMMDAYGSLFSVPYQLTTVEAVREMSRSLRDDGVMIFNVGSAITGRGSQFLQAELATFHEVFPQVFVFKVHAEYPDDRLQNLMVVATRSVETPILSSTDPELAALLSQRYTTEIPISVPALTDDLAPVEYYNSVAQNIFIAAKR